MVVQNAVEKQSGGAGGYVNEKNGEVQEGMGRKTINNNPVGRREEAPCTKKAPKKERK